MRIGLITGEYPPMQGGVGAYTHILAQVLSQQGHEVAVISGTQAAQSSPSITLENNIPRWDYTIFSRINQWSKRHQLDILNLQFQTAAFGMSPWIHLLPQMTTLPLVTTFHDLRHPYLFPKAGFLRDWVVRHLARTSTGVIVTNHEDFQQLEGLPRLTLIPIGSNVRLPLPADFNPAAWRALAHAQPHDFLIAYFGLFNHTKGLETLFESVAELRRDAIPARLIMVGGGTGSSDPTNAAYLAQLQNRVQQLQLEDYIHWTGYLEDEASVGAYLTASDAVALPFTDGASYRRGSLMAAIHYHCPIVTTTPQIDIPAFEHAENMLLVAPGNTSALSHALRQLHQSPEFRYKLQRGAAALSLHFDWSSIGRDTIQFFQQVLQKTS
ncbi:MAG: glycosyltransferase family 4 protein [Anaerolineae bacterium]|nr:glycosyltransferase family 4 protein [Anaerolineae bacterium]